MDVMGIRNKTNIIIMFIRNILYSGLPSQAFEYVYYNGGIETEEDYPYTAKDGKCKFNSSEVAATVTGVVNITKVFEKDDI